ncbi:YegP family protein [Flavobacteriaceae bacterium TK19130]|nr:YegP family protein [Thermobacterium salinum]
MGKFILKKDKAGKFRFNLKASNGQIVLSSQAYSTKSGALKGIDSVIRNSKHTARFIRKKARDGSYYFVLKASNGQIIGKSTFYSSRTGREGGISIVKDSNDRQKAHNNV